MKSFLLFAAFFLCSSLTLADAYNYNSDYELVAASQTTQVIGPQASTTALSIGDLLDEVLIVPETTGAGTVAIKDGSDTAINIFVAGTLSDLKPYIVHLGMRSRLGAWQITTGANVHVIAIGRFK